MTNTSMLFIRFLQTFLVDFLEIHIFFLSKAKKKLCSVLPQLNHHTPVLQAKALNSFPVSSSKALNRLRLIALERRQFTVETKAGLVFEVYNFSTYNSDVGFSDVFSWFVKKKHSTLLHSLSLIGSNLVFQASQFLNPLMD